MGSIRSVCALRSYPISAIPLHLPGPAPSALCGTYWSSTLRLAVGRRHGNCTSPAAGLGKKDDPVFCDHSRLRLCPPGETLSPCSGNRHRPRRPQVFARDPDTRKRLVVGSIHPEQRALAVQAALNAAAT